MRRLLFQVLVLAGVLVGLSRLAGRAGRPPGGSGGPAHPTGAQVTQPADEMANTPPDLTFYRTLGSLESAPGGGSTGGTAYNNNNKDTGGGGRLNVPFDAGQGAFLVQALATHDRPAAGRLRDRLAGRGFPATVTEDQVAGQRVYRVRAGRYRTRQEAEAAVGVLQKRFGLNPWILQEGD